MKLPRQRYEKSHKWWHSIARGDKYYTNHCLSGMGISFAIWPWIRMVVVNKMFEQMKIFMWYTRDPNTLMKMRFIACSRNLMKTACQMAMIKSWFLFLSKSICLLQNISTQRANLEQAFLNFLRRRHFYPDSNREWEKGLYTVKEKSDCAARYILLIGMIAKPNSIQIYNKYMFWN